MRNIFILISLFITVASAHEYKSVFNCNAKDMSYIASRMVLIERTMDMIQKSGDSTDFALTIHGNCSKIVSKDYDLIVKEDEIESVKLAQSQLIKLDKRGVKIVVCAMSLNANAIDESSVISAVKISPNSYLDTIKYQNNGYALMVFE
ncbi:putative protein [Sulfurimonas denitrificans DSM 1251]|uniref:Uncharacterized protein n=1 Tax=Sulfurimonas denitrificans (strain ATCC 33889 / DSM 1251) TaxID=326298 RepID=Q30PE7_SULDN|nr:DsrE family protein [Sulfurimonas denitrificans]ABB45134.1 putative protein [Sulfurimonas denitrificans DSM 1251]MDD3442799.1 DsrE family protein [Sulfurimonas denitrificans]